MKPGAVFVAVVAVVLAVVCARMGLWQLSRYNEKLALGRHYREALAAPPVALPPALARVEKAKASVQAAAAPVQAAAEQAGD